MYSVSVNNRKFSVHSENGSLFVNGTEINWDIHPINDRIYHIIENGRSYNLEILDLDSRNKKLKLKINNRVSEIGIKDDLDLLLEKLGMNQSNGNKVENIKAPMPGLILDILVEAGSEVKKGDVLMILEAMKMENSLKSPLDGKVKEILVKKGESVEKNQTLVQF